MNSINVLQTEQTSWKTFLNDILVPYIVKNFSDYIGYQLNIHLASHLNIQELYCYEFYEIRSVFDASVYNLKSPNRFQSINFGNPVIIRALPVEADSTYLYSLNNTHPITHMHTLVMVKYKVHISYLNYSCLI